MTALVPGMSGRKLLKARFLKVVMMMSLSPIVVAMILAGCGVLGDALVKFATLDSNRHLRGVAVILAMMIYAATALGWYYVMKHAKLATIGVYYSLVTIILLVIIGVTYFREKLSVAELIGISLAIAAIGLLARFR